MSILSALFRRHDPQKVKRLYVVVGDPSQSPFEKYKEPPYETDPRAYGLQLLDQPVSDEQFEREYRHKLRAFPSRDDAISCICCCNLDTVLSPVFDRVGDEWVYNKEETGKLVDEIV